MKTAAKKVNEIEKVRLKLFGPANGDEVDKQFNRLLRALVKEAVSDGQKLADDSYPMTDEEFSEKWGFEP